MARCTRCMPPSDVSDHTPPLTLARGTNAVFRLSMPARDPSRRGTRSGRRAASRSGSSSRLPSMRADFAEPDVRRLIVGRQGGSPRLTSGKGVSRSPPCRSARGTAWFMSRRNMCVIRPDRVPVRAAPGRPAGAGSAPAGGAAHGGRCSMPCASARRNRCRRWPCPAPPCVGTAVVTQPARMSRGASSAPPGRFSWDRRAKADGGRWLVRRGREHMARRRDRHGACGGAPGALPSAAANPEAIPC